MTQFSLHINMLNAIIAEQNLLDAEDRMHKM